MKKNFHGGSAMLHVIILLSLLYINTTDVYAQATANIKFSNSYVNITKNAVGGTVEPNDILEIRTTLYIRSTYNVGGRLYFLRYVDNIPTNTVIEPASTLNTITNEGVVLTSYSQGADADAGTYLAAPPAGDYQVKINMGGPSFGVAPTAPLDNSLADETGASDLRGNVNLPRFGGGTLISTAFRVQVSGAIGDVITLGAGHLAFKLTNGAGDPDTIVNAVQYQILISPNESVCSNTVGANFASEFGGSFGSGNTHNRPTAPDFPIPGYTYLNNVQLYPTSVSVNDGFYALVNNTSPKSATNTTSRQQPNCAIPAGPIPAADSCNGRMFGGFWDIGGDHTGTNDAIGNPPPGPGVNGGYMLMVNCDVATTEAYRQTISGLCPETYYEFSAWVKNICPVCGLNTNAGQTYTPGVLPNLTFVVDDVDRYSSGQINVVGWVKKGFLFRTNPGQTSITISIRNNAPGGGGNDWVLDDIRLATCSPSLVLTPDPLTRICLGNQVDLSTYVSSYFPNYAHWTYEKSTDGGTTWIPEADNVATPVFNAGQYEYTANYPSFIADAAEHNNIYRIRIASSLDNLHDPSCSFLSALTIQIYVDNCQWLLKTDFLGVNGVLRNKQATINWTVADEAPDVNYTLEKSMDRVKYTPVHHSVAKGITDAIATYSFTDPVTLTGPTYYRIKMVDRDKKQKYSSVVLLNPAGLHFEVKSIVNPFRDMLNFDVIVPTDGTAVISLVDDYGKTVKQQRQKLQQGINAVKIFNTTAISNGNYVLRIQYQNEVVNKRVMKLDR